MPEIHPAPESEGTPASQQATVQHNGYAVTALVLGLLALGSLAAGCPAGCITMGLLLVPLGGVSAILGALAVVFGFIGNRQIQREDGQGAGAAIAGIACGAAALVLITLSVIVGVLAVMV